MLVLVTVKQSPFTLEIQQSQYRSNGYFAVITDGCRVLWSQGFWSEGFDDLESAIRKHKDMFKQILLTEKCRKLADKYFKESQYYESIDEPVEAKLYLKKYSFYSRRFLARREMNLWIDEEYPNR